MFASFLVIRASVAGRGDLFDVLEAGLAVILPVDPHDRTESAAAQAVDRR